MAGTPMPAAIRWISDRCRRGLRPRRTDRGLVGLGCALTLLGATMGGIRTPADAPPPRPVPVAASTSCGPGWTTAWMAASQEAGSDPGLADSTLRLVVYPTVSGAQIRIRLSNAHGREPLPIGAASVGRADRPGPEVRAGTLRPVGFDGRRRTVLPPGGELLSDPVALDTEAGQPVVVSVHLPAAPPTLTAHLAALQTSYVAAGGDLTLTPGGGRFDRTLSSWPILVGLDVRTPQAENAVLAVGDSITDGIGSPPDAAERLTDGLAGRLAAAGGPRAMAVLNAGISGNQLLAGDRTIGPAAATRLDRELAATVGVTDVVLHIGTNDIAAGRSATEIIDGLSHYADRAQAAGRRVFLTTITPTTSGAHGTPAAMRVRAAVNSWIRAHGAQRATGVFDFAAAVADPQAPTRLATAFDSGDGLHLSAAGYRALAAAVDLDRLTGSPCRSDPSAGSRTVIAER